MPKRKETGDYVDNGQKDSANVAIALLRHLLISENKDSTERSCLSVEVTDKKTEELDTELLEMIAD